MQKIRRIWFFGIPTGNAIFQAVTLKKYGTKTFGDSTKEATVSVFRAENYIHPNKKTLEKIRGGQVIVILCDELKVGRSLLLKKSSDNESVKKIFTGPEELVKYLSLKDPELESSFVLKSIISGDFSRDLGVRMFDSIIAEMNADTKNYTKEQVFRRGMEIMEKQLNMLQHVKDYFLTEFTREAKIETIRRSVEIGQENRAGQKIENKSLNMATITTENDLTYVRTAAHLGFKIDVLFVIRKNGSGYISCNGNYKSHLPFILKNLKENEKDESWTSEGSLIQAKPNTMNNLSSEKIYWTIIQSFSLESISTNKKTKSEPEMMLQN